ncbi:MAG: signal peptide peptidase SppA [Streptosporangiales bacterium]|nr:signal peptide peptidase SppA [Streptosporangiales bacterium]
MTGQASLLLDQLRAARRKRTAPLVLEVDLTQPLVEGVPHDPLTAALSFRKQTLRGTVDALHRAGRDPRVRALVAKVGGNDAMGLARAQELREAVTAFRSGGKPALAWAESFAEFGPGNGAYLLATGFDEIWLQPSGNVGLTGIAAVQLFLRGALDQVNAKARFGQRHEYKNAVNALTESGFTEAHRESVQAVVTAGTGQLVTRIAESRGLGADEVRALVDRGPFLAAEALEARLVDRLGYRDEVYDEVRHRAGDDAELLFLGRYGRSGLEQLTRRVGSGSRDVIGLVHVTGGIHLGRSGGARPLSRQSAGSDTVAAAVRAATLTPEVRAIVLRVDSPGGSYTASDTIWRAVGRARAAGKTVVTSMGEVAASGGYFVSMGTHAIVAEPATLTGSIGVLGGKVVLDDLVGRFGVTRDAVSSGEHALLQSSLYDYTDADRERLDAFLDHVYDDFTAKVAEGRRLSRDRAHELARGRVWTGEDAHTHGLVDELGGLTHAIEVAKRYAGIPATVETEVRLFPRSSPIAQLMPAQSSEDPAAHAARVMASGWGTFAGLAAQLGLPAYGPLSLPGDWRLR